MPTTIAPVSIGGFGYMSLTTSSADVKAANITLGPGQTNNLPTTLPTGMMTFWNSIDSASNAYIALLGGTAASTTSIPLAPGQSAQFSLPAGVTPAAVSGSTATLFVIW